MEASRGIWKMKVGRCMVDGFELMVKVKTLSGNKKSTVPGDFIARVKGAFVHYVFESAKRCARPIFFFKTRSDYYTSLIASRIVMLKSRERRVATTLVLFPIFMTIQPSGSSRSVSYRHMLSKARIVLSAPPPAPLWPPDRVCKDSSQRKRVSTIEIVLHPIPLSP